MGSVDSWRVRETHPPTQSALSRDNRFWNCGNTTGESQSELSCRSLKLKLRARWRNLSPYPKSCCFQCDSKPWQKSSTEQNRSSKLNMRVNWAWDFSIFSLSGLPLSCLIPYPELRLVYVYDQKFITWPMSITAMKKNTSMIWLLSAKIATRNCIWQRY